MAAREMQEVTAARPEPRPVKLRLLRAIPLVLVLAVVVHVVLPRLDTIEDSLETLRRMSPWLVALALAAEVLSYVANGGVLQAVIRLAGERLSLRRAVTIEIGAGSVALVAAGALGFGAAIYKWTRNSGVSTDTAMLASWMPSLFDSASLILFAMVSAVELLHFHQLSRTSEVALVIVVTILGTVIATAIVLLARGDWMMALAQRMARLLKRIMPSADDQLLTDAADRAARMWQTMHRGGWIRPVVSSLLVLLFDVACLGLVFFAAGVRVPPGVLLAGYGVPLLLGRASLLPGGIAVIEVAMAALYGGLGVDASVAVVAVLVYRLIAFWLPALAGIPIAIVLQSKKQVLTGSCT